MQFKKAVEDHREGHAIGSAGLAATIDHYRRSLHEGFGGGEVRKTGRVVEGNK